LVSLLAPTVPRHPWVDFTNMCLPAAITLADPQSAKRQSSRQCLFALWGSALLKATHKTLGKSTTSLRYWTMVSIVHKLSWGERCTKSLACNWSKETISSDRNKLSHFYSKLVKSQNDNQISFFFFADDSLSQKI